MTNLATIGKVCLIAAKVLAKSVIHQLMVLSS